MVDVSLINIYILLSFKFLQQLPEYLVKSIYNF